jgi:hypothetical protein
MENDYRDYTATMARVFASQGHWGKAAAIYRHLSGQETDREDLKQLLAEAERRAAAARVADERGLVALFQQWLELLHTAERIAKLRRLAQEPSLISKTEV